FMKLGWKILIPVSLAWIVAVAAIRSVTLDGGFDRSYLIAGVVIAFVAFVLLSVVGDRKPAEKPEREPGTDFDAFAGGYPVPPMPGERLPEPTTVATTGSEEDARA
ncbi:MAG: NADH-quinone oxidoreductase subunit H, partial [Nocardioidaceae bacterium]